MLTLGLTGHIWVCVEPVDGRKSFDGLAAVVTAQVGRDPLSGDLFVFKNRRGDRLKILAWQGDGHGTGDDPRRRGSAIGPAAATLSAAAACIDIARSIISRIFFFFVNHG